MTSSSIRILGLTEQHITQQGQRFVGKDAALYNELAQRYTMVGMVCAELSKTDYYLSRLRSFDLNRTRWIMQTVMSPQAFQRRSLLAERELAQWGDRYDLLFQLHTLVAPGLRQPERPYVLTSDNTYALSDRSYHNWAPLRGNDRAEWFRREKEIYQNAAYLFPWSEFVRRSMIEDYDIPPERVVAVGAGLNITPGQINGKRYDTQTAIFVGSDFARKGGHTLLQAWQLVHRQLPGARLQIVGTRKQEASAQPGVEWIGRVSERSTLAQLYAQATVFVMPSLFEPWGHVFLEAMAHGLPCIGSNCCAMPEIIQDGVTGLLTPPGEPETLAEALVQLLVDTQRTEQMGHAGYADVLQNRTWSNIVDRMAPFIANAIEAHEAYKR
jgi:glycosyltransferase involved in cell wall biosynthesis